MRYMKFEQVKAGMVVGQDIYDGDGCLLIAKDLVLNAEYIENLKRMGFAGVYVRDELTDEIDIKDVISPEVRREAVREVRELFLTNDGIEATGEEEEQIRQMVQSVVEQVIDNEEVLYNVMDLKNYDNYTYFHSVSVAVLSAVIGARMKMTTQELLVLTTAAFLHDIGKKFLDIEILNSSQKLTRAQVDHLLQHPMKGYEFLKTNFKFPPMVALGVLEHHEWYNGEGYPLHKSGNDIPLCARIIKIADVYDAMTSKRPYHEPISPAETVEYIMARMETEFDPNVLRYFLKSVAVYPVGCEVELSNGQHAVIIENFKDYILRPKIKVLETGQIINLVTDEDARNITIIKLV